MELDDARVGSQSLPSVHFLRIRLKRDSRRRELEEVVQHKDRRGRSSFLEVRDKGSEVRKLEELVDGVVRIGHLPRPHPVDRLAVCLIEFGNIVAIRFVIVLQPGMKARCRNDRYGSIVGSIVGNRWLF